MTKRVFASVLVGVVLVLAATGCSGSGQKAAETTSVQNFVTADVDSAVDEEDLVNRATLVIVGTPEGKIEEKVTTQDGMFGSYYQTVRVHEVLMGETEDNTVRVVRAGVSSKGKDNTTVEGLRGPLPQGKMILFLQPSAEAGVMQVVGHFSGEMVLDAAEEVSVVSSELTAFKGLDVAGVRQKIDEYRNQ